MAANGSSAGAGLLKGDCFPANPEFQEDGVTTDTTQTSANSAPQTASKITAANIPADTPVAHKCPRYPAPTIEKATATTAVAASGQRIEY